MLGQLKAAATVLTALHHPLYNAKRKVRDEVHCMLYPAEQDPDTLGFYVGLVACQEYAKRLREIGMSHANLPRKGRKLFRFEAHKLMICIIPTRQRAILTSSPSLIYYSIMDASQYKVDPIPPFHGTPAVVVDGQPTAQQEPLIEDKKEENVKTEQVQPAKKGSSDGGACGACLDMITL
ncbi:hypothetical protein FRB94_005447 [Tulasnella sp. JGI-2019a]|nr:hypothetical protein FRB94_005447 [Tulasnella sp. JGI-2019a]